MDESRQPGSEAVAPTAGGWSGSPAEPPGEVYIYIYIEYTSNIYIYILYIYRERSVCAFVTPSSLWFLVFILRYHSY